MNESTASADNLCRLGFSFARGTHDAWVACARLVDLAAGDAAPGSWLSPAELRQYSQFQFELRQRSFLLGRLAAKRAVARSLGEPDLKLVELSNGVLGQPLVRAGGGFAPEVTLSHWNSGAVAVGSPAGYLFGIDFEPVEPSGVDTIRSHLALTRLEREWAESGRVPAEQAYTLLWTTREALGKATRCGILAPIEILEATAFTALGEGAWQTEYRNFPQFKCLSWMSAKAVLSLAYPSQVSLSLVNLPGLLGF